MKKIITPILLSSVILVPNFVVSNTANASESIQSNQQPYSITLQDGKVLQFDSKESYENDVKNKVNFEALANDIENCFDTPLAKPANNDNLIFYSKSSVAKLKKQCSSYTTKTKTVRIGDAGSPAYTSQHVVSSGKSFTKKATVNLEGGSFEFSTTATAGSSQTFDADKRRKSVVSIYQKFTFYTFKCGKYRVFDKIAKEKAYFKLRYL